MFPQYQPTIRATKLKTYPTMESLDAVVNYCKAELSQQDSQRMIGLLFIYHNTLLNQLES